MICRHTRDIYIFILKRYEKVHSVYVTFNATYADRQPTGSKTTDSVKDSGTRPVACGHCLVASFLILTENKTKQNLKSHKCLGAWSYFRGGIYWQY